MFDFPGTQPDHTVNQAFDRARLKPEHLSPTPRCKHHKAAWTALAQGDIPIRLSAIRQETGVEKPEKKAGKCGWRKYPDLRRVIEKETPNRSGFVEHNTTIF